MTKAELIEKLASIPDDAVIVLVGHDHHCNDVADSFYVGPNIGGCNEYQLHPTQGRT